MVARRRLGWWRLQSTTRRRQVDPDVSVQSRGGDTLEDGTAHPGYLKPYFFLAERVNKSCERRKFSCICQRSSGVAARLRANRYFSSSLRPRTRRIFLNTRAIFFHVVTVALGARGRRGEKKTNETLHSGAVPPEWRGRSPTGFPRVPSDRCAIGMP